MFELLGRDKGYTKSPLMIEISASDKCEFELEPGIRNVGRTLAGAVQMAVCTMNAIDPTNRRTNEYIQTWARRSVFAKGVLVEIPGYVGHAGIVDPVPDAGNQHRHRNTTNSGRSISFLHLPPCMVYSVRPISCARIFWISGATSRFIGRIVFEFSDFRSG